MRKPDILFLAAARQNYGEVPERLNGLVSKTSMELVFIGSSNLPLSALEQPLHTQGLSLYGTLPKSNSRQLASLVFYLDGNGFYGQNQLATTSLKKIRHRT